MTDDSKKMGTADLGYLAVGRAASRQPTEEEIQRGILRSMREVVARPYNPNALRAPDNTKVANAPAVVDGDQPVNRSGWAEERPLPIHSAKGSREEALIDAMVEKFVGGPNKPVK